MVSDQETKPKDTVSINKVTLTVGSVAALLAFIFGLLVSGVSTAFTAGGKTGAMDTSIQNISAQVQALSGSMQSFQQQVNASLTSLQNAYTNSDKQNSNDISSLKSEFSDMKEQLAEIRLELQRQQLPAQRGGR